MSSAAKIGYPVDRIRQVAQQVGALSDDLQQLTDNMWTVIEDQLGDLPLPIKTILELVIQVLKRDLNHLLNERTTLAHNLSRVADLAEQLDRGTSQGFDSTGISAGITDGTAGANGGTGG